MGWSGYQNAWYNLPTIDTAIGTFDTVTDCIYNIFTSGSGEIVSGRVTDAAGNPLSGMTVTAEQTTGGTYTATSDANGIYAFAKIPARSTYTISAAGAGYTFQSVSASTSRSRDSRTTVGNVWGVNLQADNAPPPAAPAGPTPADTQTAVPTDTALSWNLGQASPGVTFTVYLDTNNPPAVQVAAGQSAAVYTAASLQNTTTYYWQVIAVSASGSTPGPVWSFTTQGPPPGTPTNPSPPDGRADVPLDVTLSWNGGQGGPGLTFDVYLDTANPPLAQVAAGQTAATFESGALQAATRYYWRIVSRNGVGQTQGPVWTFTTHIPGDINGDGGVNVGDLQVLAAAWASQATPQSGNWNADADVNDDGYVNVADLQMLLASWNAAP